MSRTATAYVNTVIACGFVMLLYGIWSSAFTYGIPLVTCVAAAAVLGPLKLRLPGLTGTYSPTFLPVLWAVAHLSLSDSMLTAIVVALSGSYINALRRPTFQQVLFNAANLGLSVSLCCVLLSRLVEIGLPASHPAIAAFTAAVYFIFNTGVVSGILALLSGKAVREVVSSWYNWSLVYHLIGSAALSGLPWEGQTFSWDSAVPLLSLLGLVQFYCSLTRATREETHAGRPGAHLPLRAQIYVGAVYGAAVAVIAATFEVPDLPRFCGWALLTALAASRKVYLPGMEATLSMGFIAVLAAVTELPAGETVILALIAAAVQCVWRPVSKPRPFQVVFSTAALVLSAAAASAVSQLAAGLNVAGGSLLAAMSIGTIVLYVLNTLLVAVAICIVTGDLLQIWQRFHFWVFSYYLVGAAGAGLIVSTGRSLGWAAAMLVTPAVYLAFVSYGLQVRAWKDKLKAKNVSAAA